MRKIHLLLLTILPVLLIELFLHNTLLYEKILLYNADFTEWSQAAPFMNYWPKTVIIGSSIARYDISPKILQETLKTGGISTTVGSIALNADSTATDYLTLKRILATCKTCPKQIIYQVTDVSLRDHETAFWKEVTRDKVLKLYYPDEEIDAVLQKAASLDPYFHDYLATLTMQKSLRTGFIKGRLISLVINTASGFLMGRNNDVYDPTYADDILLDKGYGYYPYTRKLTQEIKQRSLNFYRSYLWQYHVGGVTELFTTSFLELAKKHHIQVILVIAPVMPLYHKTFSNEMNQYTKLVNQIALRQKLPIIDDSHFNIQDENVFLDINHLNTIGSTIFSKHLATQLAKVWR